MTEKRAMAWARKRWGKRAYVNSVRRDGVPLRRVGHVIPSPFGAMAMIEGEGPTWQDAVDNAARTLPRAALAPPTGNTEDDGA